MTLTKSQIKEIESYRKVLIFYLQKNNPFLPYHDIEDIAQNAIIKAIQTIDIEKFEKYKSFLVSIASNLVIDLYRRPFKNKECNQDFFAQDTANIFTYEDFTEEYCSAKFNKDLIKKLFDGLQNNLSIQMFVEAKVYDVSYADLAAKYNSSQPCIRKRIERARKILMKKYSEITNDIF